MNTVDDPFDESVPHEPLDEAEQPRRAGLDVVDLGSRAKKGNIFPDIAETKEERVAKANGSGYVEITVSDPERKGDALSAYVTYKVNTKVMAGDANSVSQSSVVRRYSDFAWLHDQLLERNPGWLIPPLPEKAFMGRFKESFVDSRRRGLELFLNRLAKHEHLSKSEEFHLFLHGGQEFLDCRDGRATPSAANNAAEPPKKAKGFFDYFNDVAQTVSSTLGTAKERERTTEDRTCDGIGAYADVLEASVGNVHKSITLLTRRTKALQEAWRDFGEQATLLGQEETRHDEPDLGQAFARLGSCADRLSVLLAQQVDTEVIHFEEPFQDLLRIVSSVKLMLKSREAVLNNYLSAVASLEAKQSSLARYQGKAGKEDKAQQAERDVAEQQKVVDASNTELQNVTQRVFQETARFRHEKRVNFKNVMLDFVRTQIEHSRKVQQAWESILPELESLPFGDA